MLVKSVGELGVCLEQMALGHAAKLGGVEHAFQPSFELLSFDESGSDYSP